MTITAYTDVEMVATPNDKSNLAPALAKLAAPTEMSSYGEEQWKFLLHAGNVQAFVVRQHNGVDDDQSLLGSVLRIEYGTAHHAFGMMLVSPEARGQGLAKKLLNAAMVDYRRDETDARKGGIKILGTCTELGRPMYEKMGFQRVSTVTRLSIQMDKLTYSFPQTTDEWIFTVDDKAHVEDFLKLDQKATGLDRSATLKALLGYPYVKLISLSHRDHLQTIAAVALVTQHTGSSSVTVGPILGTETLVPTLLQGMAGELLATATNAVVTISDHPSLVHTLQHMGFQTIFELGAMTMDGVSFPGERDNYLGLIHPTLG